MIFQVELYKKDEKPVVYITNFYSAYEYMPLRKKELIIFYLSSILRNFSRKYAFYIF